jgi:hypothetical protein
MKDNGKMNDEGRTMNLGTMKETEVRGRKIAKDLKLDFRE